MLPTHGSLRILYYIYYTYKHIIVCIYINMNIYIYFQEFGGGGHRNASSFTLSSMEFNQWKVGTNAWNRCYSWLISGLFDIGTFVSWISCRYFLVKILNVILFQCPATVLRSQGRRGRRRAWVIHKKEVGMSLEFLCYTYCFLCDLFISSCFSSSSFFFICHLHYVYYLIFNVSVYYDRYGITCFIYLISYAYACLEEDVTIFFLFIYWRVKYALSFILVYGLHYVKKDCVKFSLLLVLNVWMKSGCVVSL